MRSVGLFLVVAGLGALGACREPVPTADDPGRLAAEGSARLDPVLVARGREIFRHDTYGNETFWTDTLRIHEVIARAVSPRTALAVGLKVDLERLPPDIRRGIAAGTVNLDDPATTVALLGLDAVVGLRARVEGTRLVRVGVTCALCHSTVDNAFAPGIGRRLDGWPNRDLDPGRIIALSPAITPEQRAVYESWGPGMYDPRFNIDGINLPVVLPPALGLREVARETYTGDGPVSYWNAYVAITQMHGHGRFVDERLGIRVNNPPERVAPKLTALRLYQFSLASPRADGEDPDQVRRGRALFIGPARCATCHVPPTYTDVNAGRLHEPGEVGQEPAYAERTATKRYRTTPLRGLWRPPLLAGPYFHDGSAPTLEAVVEHYVRVLGLELTTNERADLVAFLKTL